MTSGNWPKGMMAGFVPAPVLSEARSNAVRSPTIRLRRWKRTRDYFSSSIITAFAPVADSRTLLPSMPATRPMSM